MATEPSLSAPSHPPVRILYAEDVRELRDLASVVFRREGHSIECVEDGSDALNQVIQRPGDFDLIITDHHMPRMNGLEFVAELRRLRFPGKIMVFSSEINPAIAADYERLGVDRILFKPVYPSYLRQAIAELFPVADSAAPALR